MNITLMRLLEIEDIVSQKASQFSQISPNDEGEDYLCNICYLAYCRPQYILKDDQIMTDISQKLSMSFEEFKLLITFFLCASLLAIAIIEGKYHKDKKVRKQMEQVLGKAEKLAKIHNLASNNAKDWFFNLRDKCIKHITQFNYSKPIDSLKKYFSKFSEN